MDKRVVKVSGVAELARLVVGSRANLVQILVVCVGFGLFGLDALSQAWWGRVLTDGQLTALVVRSCVYVTSTCVVCWLFKTKRLRVLMGGKKGWFVNLLLFR